MSAYSVETASSGLRLRDRSKGSSFDILEECQLEVIPVSQCHLPRALNILLSPVKIR